MISDRAFQKVFQHLFVYNILFEDSEVDEQFLGLGSDSTILTISGAGCRVAGHLSAHPQRIDAVDINGSHLALTALKVAAATKLRSYELFYSLFGRGKLNTPERVLRTLVADLPPWIQKYWQNQSTMFSESIHRRGMAANLFAALRKMTNVDARWLGAVSRLPQDERQRVVRETFAPILYNRTIAAMLASPVNLLALGINYSQCDRMLRADESDISGFLLNVLTRIAATDLERNWFAWHAVAGKFNEDAPDGVPPYLRKDRHERSIDAPTQTHYHKANIFDVLDEAAHETWSHYVMCDALDWMSPDLQRRLLVGVLRSSRPGGTLAYRSVEGGSIVERLGLQEHFQLDVEASQRACAMERTRIFQAVNYYRILH